MIYSVRNMRVRNHMLYRKYLVQHLDLKIHKCKDILLQGLRIINLYIKLFFQEEVI